VDAASLAFLSRRALGTSDRKQIYVLGADIDEAQAPQIVVPPNEWQSARSLGDYTLVGCTVAPGFEFAHFEMRPDGFTP
jgi:predicted cupin superfamily sugar epimerase